MKNVSSTINIHNLVISCFIIDSRKLPYFFLTIFFLRLWMKPSKEGIKIERNPGQLIEIIARTNRLKRSYIATGPKFSPPTHVDPLLDPLSWSLDHRWPGNHFDIYTSIPSLSLSLSIYRAWYIRSRIRGSNRHPLSWPVAGFAAPIKGLTGRGLIPLGGPFSHPHLRPYLSLSLSLTPPLPAW